MWKTLGVCRYELNMSLDKIDDTFVEASFELQNEWDNVWLSYVVVMNGCLFLVLKFWQIWLSTLAFR